MASIRKGEGEEGNKSMNLRDLPRGNRRNLYIRYMQLTFRLLALSQIKLN